MQLFLFLFLVVSSSTRYTGFQGGKYNISTDISPNKNPEKFKLTLNVDLPVAWFQYVRDKPLKVKSGGSFALTTPTESYEYQSYGNVDLRCVSIRYFVQSTFNPNQMCFALYFLSNKVYENEKPFQIDAHQHNNKSKSNSNNVSHPWIQRSPKNLTFKEPKIVPVKRPSKAVKSQLTYTSVANKFKRSN